MLKHQIQNDATNALKSDNQLMAETLRMVLAFIITKEKEKRYKISKHLSAQAGKPELKEEELIKESGLTDEEIIDVLSSEIKKRKDAIVLYEKGNRQELADKEKEEIEVLKKYLPEQLSEEELKKIIKESINRIKDPSSPAGSSGQVMGKVMQDLMPKVKGKADASEISRIVKELLSGGK